MMKPPEPPRGSVVVDRFGVRWMRIRDIWVDSAFEVTLPWAILVEMYGPAERFRAAQNR